MNSATKSATRRYWPRFTLRAMLALVTILCIALGWWMHRAREQRNLVKRIESNGGNVYYDFQYDAPSEELAESPVPKWLLDRLGADFFHSVKEVGTEDPSVLPELPRFWRLERLAVGAMEWTDEDIAPLARLRGLQYLFVALGDNETPLPPLGDSSLAVIAELPRLESAWIKGARISPAGITSLARSTSLRRINVACADPAVDARVAAPFRQSGRVSYFCVELWSPAVAPKKVVEWDTIRERGVAAPP
jgi:hypothetical protein